MEHNRLVLIVDDVNVLGGNMSSIKRVGEAVLEASSVQRRLSI
jgi:hypothetical protein